MKIYYRKNDTGVEIVRCKGTTPKIVIPKKINQIPVTKIGPYAFSDKRDVDETICLIYETEEMFDFSSDDKLLAGEYIEGIIFPDTVQLLGNYAFYGCKNLKTLEFSNGLMQIGSGAFTGCGKLSHLRIRMRDGLQSCAKEILGELWQRIDITFLYEKEQAELVFPEHYEEAVENTPARILFTQHHGSGNDYRQCFYNKELDYAKYDSLSPIAAAREKTGVLADLVLKRLQFPYELSKKYLETYTSLLKVRYKEILEYLIDKEALRALQIYTEKDLWTQDMLDFALGNAAAMKRTEISAYLMNQREKYTPVNKKTFLL